MIDTDKYEPTHIDTLIHQTRAHSPDGWRELSKSLIELSDDDRLLIECVPTLRAEVTRLRELFSIAAGSRDDGYCITMRLAGCEYIGTLRLYTYEEGKVIA